MLKNFYRAMVIARAGSAAAHVALNMTDKQLADAGIDRRTFPLEAMEMHKKRTYNRQRLLVWVFKLLRFSKHQT